MKYCIEIEVSMLMKLIILLILSIAGGILQSTQVWPCVAVKEGGRAAICCYYSLSMTV